MTFSTYERYDENEYFLKFLTIHPILLYSTDKYDNHKKLYQQYLIDLFNTEKLTYEELENQYNKLIKIETENKIILEQIKVQHTKIEENIIKTMNNNLIELCKTNLNILNKK
jgi:hypothetical protein